MPKVIRTPADSLFHPDAKAILLQRLGSVAPESERCWGRMTAHQMVCHLGDMFRMAISERPAQPIGGALEHTVLRWIALASRNSWVRFPPS